MSTVAYSSQSGKAKPSKAIYCSVNGKAKLVKRIYGSVGGKGKIIYDTCTVTYIKDNDYIDNTTVTYTEVIGKGCLIPQKDDLHWYKSDGTEWDFNSDRVQGDVTLYEAVYSSISNVTFDGSHYCPTDVKIAINSWDQRGACTPSNITVQRRIFGIRGKPTVEMYINGSGYWNVGVGNKSSSITWSAAANKVKAAVNTTLSWRFNLATSSTKYLQLWQGSQSAIWASVSAVSSVTADTGFCIGRTNALSDLPFSGTIEYISFTARGSTDGTFQAYQRKKGGSTVQGFRWTGNSKFYPLISV